MKLRKKKMKIKINKLKQITLKRTKEGKRWISRNKITLIIK